MGILVFMIRRTLILGFAEFAMARDPYPLKESLTSLPKEEMDTVVRSAFQLGPEIEWRWPEPGERIYHRPADGFVPVWLEHLRSGWNPRWHLLFKHLCKYVYKCSPMQITPNGIKWMIRGGDPERWECTGKLLRFGVR